MLHHQEYRTVQKLGEDIYAVPDVVTSKSPGSSSSGRHYFSKHTSWLLVTLSQITSAPTLVIGSALCSLFPSWHRRTLTWMIPQIMEVLARRTGNQRKLLLSKIQGRVLDVGAGGGGYFSYYAGKVSSVVALEPFRDLHPVLREKAEEVGIQNENIRICQDPVEIFQDDEGFDWIILGNVLCEVRNVGSALKAVDRLLKPGGNVYFCEHVGRPHGDWRRLYQNIFNPFWCKVSGGCNCNHDSLTMIQQIPNWDVVSWQFESIQVGLGPVVMGLAKKKQTDLIP